MDFLAPTAFAFLAAIPVVIVFYLLKRKRVVRLVSSTLLWQKFLAETQASAPFQKLRHNWLLILQIILLMLVILALARPYFASRVEGGRLHVIILDASASMQSRDVSPSRFEKARADSLKYVDSLHDNDQMIVLLAGAGTEVRQSPTSSKPALRRALQATAPTDSSTRLKEALKLAETLTRDHPSAEIHLFSDGGAPDLTEFENKGLKLVYHKVGERSDNAGITSLDVRANPENAGQRAIFTSVANFSTAAKDVQLELRFGDQLLETKLVTVQPTNTAPEVFLAAQAVDGIFSVRIADEDDLATDNQASIVSLLPKPVKVILVSKGNRFLEKAVRAAGDVQLSVVNDLSTERPDADLVVLDNVPLIRWPKANVLTFRAADPAWFATGKTVETPAIVDWKATHPLLRFVSFDNVSIAESLAVKAPSWTTTLADSRDTPLILAGELDRQRIVWVGFDAMDSTWPLRISFPIFIANVVEWLNPASANAAQLLVHAGNPFRLSLTEASFTNAVVTPPDGVAKPITVDPKARELIFGDTSRQGVYSLTAGTNTIKFCVNLLDQVETDTRPRAELEFGKHTRVQATEFKKANLELWRWIAFAGLLVLMGEWWYYHKRTA